MNVAVDTDWEVERIVSTDDVLLNAGCFSIGDQGQAECLRQVIVDTHKTFSIPPAIVHFEVGEITYLGYGDIV